MPIVKQSFISNLMGLDVYERYSGYAKVIVAVGTYLLILFIGQSFFFHSGLISWFLQLLTGTSLLFITYIGALILLLDIRVDVEEPERHPWEKPKRPQPTMKYKLTKVWAVILIVLGCVAIYASNRYCKEYAFECETFLVDHQHRIYHIEWNEDCEVANEAGELEKMHGYEINGSYRLCEYCEGFLDDAGSYETERFIRR